MNVRKNGIVVARKTNNGLKANTSTTTSTGQLIRVTSAVHELTGVEGGVIAHVITPKMSDVRKLKHKGYKHIGTY